MITGYVARQVARTTRNSILTCIFILCILALIGFAMHNYIAECLHGPVDVTVNDLLQIPNPESAPHRYVRVTIDPQLLDGQAYHVTGGNDHKDDWYQFLHATPERILIIKAGKQDIPATLVGSIESTGGDVEHMVFPAMAGQLQGSMGNIVLDTSSYLFGLYLYLGITVPVAAICFWQMFVAFRRRANPLLHPAAQYLAKIGPPEEIAIAVDAEVQAGAQRVGKVLSTTSWLLFPRRYGIDLVYLGDIVWAYKLTTNHKSYGITTHKSYSTIICDAQGRKLTFPLKQQQVDTLLTDLASRVPWAFVGFDAALQKLWGANRAQFFAAVEQRKQHLAERPPVAPPVQA